MKPPSDIVTLVPMISFTLTYNAATFRLPVLTFIKNLKIIFF